MTVLTHARDTGLGQLREILLSQHHRKIDAVIPAELLYFDGGNLVLSRTGMKQLDDDGVTEVDGLYVPTDVFDEGLAEKLGIPRAYLRRLRNERPDMYDDNANGWLTGCPELTITGPDGIKTFPGVDGDKRSFMVRMFRADDSGQGVARAFLSDRFKRVDNFDVLVAALKGIQESGAETEIVGCDLTERRMRVRVAAPGISTLALALLKDYRSPYTGQTGMDIPQVFAGFEIGNSETGGGAFTITPRITFKVCKNGLTITKDALRDVHLGGKLDDGVIKWSDETQAKVIELVTARTTDAVKTFLDVDYMEGVLADMAERAGKPVDAATAVPTVCKRLGLDEDLTAGIFDCFIKGGQVTAGGVMQALTAHAQRVSDPEKAADLEALALPALELAATL